MLSSRADKNSTMYLGSQNSYYSESFPTYEYKTELTFSIGPLWIVNSDQTAAAPLLSFKKLKLYD